MKTQQQEITLLEEQLTDIHDLIVYNDDVNTFDWVIKTLMEVCGHNALQAEQCALLIHNTGKCGVKRGSMEDLIPVCETILERGISARIE
ncbi:MAG: ATP-dependent Clp protease adaptor ClpS [Bacteroidetes bacterium]|nr:ATP-dependent Clp protease adaptor ClpS [Bacteroidota bacterium]